jgi:hypothetical protein
MDVFRGLGSVEGQRALADRVGPLLACRWTPDDAAGSPALLSLAAELRRRNRADGFALFWFPRLLR